MKRFYSASGAHSSICAMMRLTFTICKRPEFAKGRCHARCWKIGARPLDHRIYGRLSQTSSAIWQRKASEPGARTLEGTVGNCVWAWKTSSSTPVCFRHSFRKENTRRFAIQTMTKQGKWTKLGRTSHPLEFVTEALCAACTERQRGTGSHAVHWLCKPPGALAPPPISQSPEAVRAWGAAGWVYHHRCFACDAPGWVRRAREGKPQRIQAGRQGSPFPQEPRATRVHAARLEERVEPGRGVLLARMAGCHTPLPGRLAPFSVR
jgi:hypothetical protein